MSGPNNLSLSAQKRKKPKLCVKNVLTVPSAPEWYVLAEEDVASVTEAIAKCFYRIDIPQTRLKKAEFRKLSMVERKAMLKELKVKQKEEFADRYLLRSKLVLGVNSVAQALTTRSVSCCLLAQEASPPEIISNLNTLGSTYNIPTVICPQLKTITNTYLGISSLAIAFKKDDNSPDLTPVTTSIIQAFTRLKGSQISSETSEEEEEEDVKMEIEASEKPEDLYLYREPGEPRAWQALRAPIIPRTPYVPKKRVKTHSSLKPANILTIKTCNRSQ